MTTVPLAPARPKAVAAPAVGVLQRPLASYYLVLASTGLLLALGLVMVMSGSSVRSYDTYGSAYVFVAKQALFVAIGLPLMWGASRLPVRFLRWVGTPLLLGSVVVLVMVLVPPFRDPIAGATRWIKLPGGLNLQPSEPAKLGLALWGADLLVRKKRLLGDWKHLLIPLLPMGCLVAFLVLLEPDMGTMLVVVTVVMALLWVVGAPARVLAVLMGVGVLCVSLLAVAAPYRLARLTSFSDPCASHQSLEGGFQGCQGLIALSSGGWFGLGLGASQEKWPGKLPNPYTDYVYAIVGEELGLLGTLTVLLLFATLVYAGVRIAKRTTDPFSRLAASGITAWIAAQSLVNIGAVVGLLPITGIPLPFISFGGSALVPTLVAVGVLLSFARREPGAPAALAARPSLRRRLRRTPVVPAQRVRR